MKIKEDLENEVIKVRREKLKKIRNSSNAFPNDFNRTHTNLYLFDKFNILSKEELEEESFTTKVVGRIKLKRVMGKASFITIEDYSGQIQLYITKNSIGEENYDIFKDFDIGDIIGASGTLFKTKLGELTINISNIKLLTKSIRPLPDKHHGLQNTELRYRQRYLDLIMNKDSRQVFLYRTKIIQFIRNYLDKLEFIEVETPMMQMIPGGATAKPFVTKHNALDADLYLRIAPELYLKRLVVGGIEKVYEINRNFRNEGVSTQHNPEFTMLEFYQAYSTYHDLISMTEDMLKKLCIEVLGTSVSKFKDIEIDWSKSFDKITMKNSIIKYNEKIDNNNINNIDYLKNYVRGELNIDINSQWGLGKIQLEIFEATVENKLIKPTFITEYPTEVSPLSRVNDNDDTITDRFELFIAGMEIANGFSELNDSEDQAERFKQQSINKKHGDEEAMYYDADYITALEYGMPPTAGEGIGIDRLVMLLTDSHSIKDVLLFPLMKNN